MFRDGDHKSVLAVIPGTTEQLQAEVLALRESMRNMRMGEGGARISVPERPVIWHSFSLFPDSGVFWWDGAPKANLPVHQRPLCVWSMQAWHSGRTSFATYSFDFCLCLVDIVYSPCLCLHLRQWLSQPYHRSNTVKYRIVPPAGTTWLGEHMALRRCWGQAFSRLKWHYHLNLHCHYHSY